MRTRSAEVKNAVIILGFNRHTPTDIYRTEEFAKTVKVYTVSRAEEKGFKDHLHANFCDLKKGRRSEILAFVREKALLHTIVSTFLDYWWPANGYFQDAYGVLWLSGWVKAILEAGAFEVILPYCDEVENMEKEKNARMGERIEKHKSALWCATEKTEGIPSSFNQKKMTGLHLRTPFIRFRNGQIIGSFLSLLVSAYTCFDSCFFLFNDV